MKKIFNFVLVLVLIFNIVSCGNSIKSEALLKYINEDLAVLSEMETKFLESYESVTGNNYINDYIMYEEFSRNTMVLSRDLNNKAIEIIKNIDDEEISELHRIYINLTSNYMNVVSLTLAALETQDFTNISLANEKLNNANNLALDFKEKLNVLAEKYNVDIEK